MHADQLERYGGANGVRDHGLLEAALYRPQTGSYGDLVEEAAALWESLSQNHPFIDGNKRTAFAAEYTFLAINRARLTAGFAATNSAEEAALQAQVGLVQALCARKTSLFALMVICGLQDQDETVQAAALGN